MSARELELQPEAGDPWAPLRASTQARIGLGRAGMSLPTRAVLDLQAALASARDAVHLPLDVAAVLAGLGSLGLGEPTLLTSRAADRSTYLRRPDLGRTPSTLDSLPSGQWDVGLVVGDGLSAKAVAAHAVPMAEALVAAIDPELSIAPPVLVSQARVAVGDEIGAKLKVATVIVLIGERPGLSVADSLGLYLTHQPRPGRTDAERNCISNIHPPEGLSYAEAAATAVRLLRGARALGRSGVDLKDVRTSALPE